MTSGSKLNSHAYGDAMPAENEAGADAQQPSESSLLIAWQAFREALDGAERARRRAELVAPAQEPQALLNFASGLSAIMRNWGPDADLLLELNRVCSTLEALSPTAQPSSGEPNPATSTLNTPVYNAQGLRESNFNAWADWYNNDDAAGDQVQRYGDTITYQIAANWLDGLDIQDWGCGYAWFKRFVTNGTYTGVDGTKTKWCDIHADLAKYRSTTPGLHMRHVIEHNVHWAEVLDNAVASFTKRMVLTLFTPFVDQTHVIQSVGLGVPDTAFKLSDITDRLTNCTWTLETHNTDTQYGVEHVFLMERD